MNMNKKYILSLLACAAFTACDMDLTPETRIGPERVGLPEI